MTGATLERRGAVFVLHLGDTENRFNFESVARITGLLDEVDAASGEKALVTVAAGKFWSNGLDLDWMIAQGIDLVDLVVRVQEMLARVLEAGYPTIAAVQGHCYAAGAMLALAHDVRFMREDRGFLCLPEVNIGMTFTSGMESLIVSKVSPQTAHRSMVLGTRYTAPQALAAGFIDEAIHDDQLLDRAVDFAASLVGKDPATMQAIKKQLYGNTLDLLRTAP